MDTLKAHLCCIDRQTGKASIQMFKCLPNDIKRIIYSPPATVVFWDDNTKTVVKCEEGRAFSPYDGLCAAIAKKYFGSNCALKKCIETKGEFKYEEK